MLKLICPCCNMRLEKKDRSLVCCNKHAFDISKKGYVNLLNSSGAARTHGDSKEMVRARTDFLNAGHYNRLKDAVCALAVKYSGSKTVLLDSGCGEGFYTTAVVHALRENGKDISALGIDISKAAVNAAAKRSAAISYAVASAFHLPVEDASVDLLLALFSPLCLDEYRRVLKNKGLLLIAFPLENHLWELKKEIYATPYKNEVADYELEKFSLLESRELKYKINLTSNREVRNLFLMTPYSYKTSQQDAAKLENIDALETTAEFGVALYSLNKEQ